MEFWLLVVIGILLIIIFSLVIKLFFVHKTVREIEAQFTERLMTETNTLIDISHRNKIMCGFAKRLNTELRKLSFIKRKEIFSYQNEYRYLIVDELEERKNIRFEIGDLKDLATIMSKSEFLKTL